VTVQAWFSSNDIDVTPGETTLIALTVGNLGSSTESFALSPTGLAAGWTTIRPAYVTLFGGSEQTVDVEVRPPRLPTTTAGPNALGIRIVPHGDPDAVEMCETTLHVTPTYDRTINMLQPALRSRRRATYELMLENQGNTQASCRLHLIDPSRRIDGDFDPPAVGVEPGGSTLVRLKVRAGRRQWERRSRSIPFQVEADQQGTPTVSGQASFVQAPVIPERIGWRLVFLVLLIGAFWGAWTGLVRPEIRRAADRAVARRVVPAPVVTIPAITVPGQPVVVPVATTTTTIVTDRPATGASGATGEPIAIPLPTGAAVGQTDTQIYTVPGDQNLEVTDILVQNTFGDDGIVSLRIGEKLLQWSLASFDGIDVNQRFVTALQVLPGQTITLEVTCTQVGRQGDSTCSPNVLISGRLIPVHPIST
jgi:hypothetical protein